MNKHKIEWIPSATWGRGHRWILEVNGRYMGRVLKSCNGFYYARHLAYESTAFSINDAGRKLLAYVLEQVK